MAVNPIGSGLYYAKGGRRAIGRLTPTAQPSANVITRGYSALSTTTLLGWPDQGLGLAVINRRYGPQVAARDLWPNLFYSHGILASAFLAGLSLSSFSSRIAWRIDG
jgi:hypothetical protein